MEAFYRLQEKMMEIRKLGLEHPDCVWLWGASARLQGLDTIIDKNLSDQAMLKWIQGWCDADDILKVSFDQIKPEKLPCRK